MKKNFDSFFSEIFNTKSYEILTKAGVLGNITPGDLRRVSLFSENDTLSLDAFEGSDVCC